MEQYQVERRIMHAIDSLRMKDNYLLWKDCSERSIVHKFAQYLEFAFPSEYDVDCEYNRNLGDKKRLLQSFPSHFNVDKYTEERLVSPDIIIHMRDSNNNNLLVVEVKKHNVADELRMFDHDKLRLFTSNEYGFNYKFGVYIEFTTLSKNFITPRIDLFCSGSIISKGRNSYRFMDRWIDFSN